MKYIITTALFILSLIQTYGQNNDTCKCNVYKTAEDFKNNYSIEGRKINWGIHFTWKGTEEVLLLKKADSTLRYKAGTAFAYVDTDCKLYRLLNINADSFVEVLSREGICLYSLRKVTYLKIGSIADTYYYFSKDIYSPIFELTKKNIIKEYADNTSFCDAIQKIKNDNELSKQDKTSQHYKVIDLYNQFKK